MTKPLRPGGVGKRLWKNPRNVPPKWTNWLRKDDLVESIILAEGDEGVTVEDRTTEGGTLIRTFTYNIDYQYNTFPRIFSCISPPIMKKNNPL